MHEVIPSPHEARPPGLAAESFERPLDKNCGLIWRFIADRDFLRSTLRLMRAPHHLL